MAASQRLLLNSSMLSLPLVTTPRTLLICALLLSTSVPYLALAYDTSQESPGDAHQFPSRRCDECVENALDFNKTISTGEAHPSSEPSNGTANSSDSKPPIDWNEVEENFHKVLSEDEVFHKWDTMEANMKSG